MQLESPTVNTNKSANKLFDFLMDVQNFEHIMPENTESFEALDQAFIFALKGMPKIKLKLQESEKPSKIIFTSASAQFPFTLTGNIAAVDDTTATVNLQFEGDFNAMMAMMIKAPLQKFINTLSENLSKL